jgi:hypothetical protein
MLQYEVFTATGNVQSENATVTATATKEAATTHIATGDVQGVEAIVSGSVTVIRVSKICETTTIAEVKDNDVIVENNTDDIISVSSDRNIYKCN